MLPFSDTLTLKERLTSIHEKMKVIADEAARTTTFPPLFCYALDEQYLPEDVYQAFYAGSKSFICDKGLPLDYAVLLCIVRAFYENTRGDDWNQAANFHNERRKASLSKKIKSFIDKKDNPWNYGERNWEDVNEWLKTQCLVLNARKKAHSSVVIDVNKTFCQLLAQKEVSLRVSGRFDETVFYPSGDTMSLFTLRRSPLINL